MADEEFEIGCRIAFTGGTYVGMKGWRKASKQDTAKMAYVAIEKENGRKKWTRVRKVNVKEIPDNEEPPDNLEDAILDQQKDVEALLRKLCKKIAMCGVTDSSRMTQIFQLYLHDAILTQNTLGPAADWKWVVFEPVENQSNATAAPTAVRADPVGGQTM